MSDQMTISPNDIKPRQIGVAKNNEIWLNSDRFIPESSIQDLELLSDVSEVGKIHQTKVESARLTLFRKTHLIRSAVPRSSNKLFKLTGTT